MYRFFQILNRNSSIKNRLREKSNQFCSSKSPTKRKDLYVTLGIESSATQAEIKQAYYNLTLQFHPDRNEGCNDAATRFKEVTEAYEILGNPTMREKYDMGVIPMDLDVLRQRKPTINHRAKYQKFFDHRNQPRSFQRPRIEDIYDKRPIQDTPEKKPFEDETPEDRIKSRKLKTALMCGLLITYVCFYQH